MREAQEILPFDIGRKTAFAADGILERDDRPALMLLREIERKVGIVIVHRRIRAIDAQPHVEQAIPGGFAAVGDRNPFVQHRFAIVPAIGDRRRDGRIGRDQIEHGLAAIVGGLGRSAFHGELGRDERLAGESDVELDFRAVAQVQRAARQAVLPRNRAELIRRGKNELELRGRAEMTVSVRGR